MQRCGDVAGVVHDLAPCEPDHAPAQQRELLVTAAVGFERLARRVRVAAVDLGDQALALVDEVGLGATA